MKGRCWKVDQRRKTRCTALHGHDGPHQQMPVRLVRLMALKRGDTQQELLTKIAQFVCSNHPSDLVA